MAGPARYGEAGWNRDGPRSEGQQRHPAALYREGPGSPGSTALALQRRDGQRLVRYGQISPRRLPCGGRSSTGPRGGEGGGARRHGGQLGCRKRVVLGCEPFLVHLGPGRARSARRPEPRNSPGAPFEARQPAARPAQAGERWCARSRRPPPTPAISDTLVTRPSLGAEHSGQASRRTHPCGGP